MIIVDGKRYKDVNEYIVKFRDSFKERYKKNVAVCEKLVKERKGIYGATLWSGCSGLPWFLSFDLDEVINYLISHTNWREHPDLARVEFINFGEHPDQQVVGHLYNDHIKDGYLWVRS